MCRIRVKMSLSSQKLIKCLQLCNMYIKCLTSCYYGNAQSRIVKSGREWVRPSSREGLVLSRFHWRDVSVTSSITEIICVKVYTLILGFDQIYQLRRREGLIILIIIIIICHRLPAAVTVETLWRNLWDSRGDGERSADASPMSREVRVLVRALPGAAALRGSPRDDSTLWTASTEWDSCRISPGGKVAPSRDHSSPLSLAPPLAPAG